MTAECKYEGCGRAARKIGYCATHYKRHRLGLDMAAPIRDMSGNHAAQFWAKVQKSEECWEWSAFRDRKGYGRHGSRVAHRVAYELTHGPIPEGLLVDHTCWNRACVNPDHLRLATDRGNAQNRAGARRGSTSGVRGVYWDKREKGWRAAAVVGSWRPYLGIFPTIEEAEAVVTKWRRANMPYSLMDQRKVE